ncbi:MAG: hypothetical protein ACFCVE_03950 [Phycisphaerae bacterium]
MVVSDGPAGALGIEGVDLAVQLADGLASTPAIVSLQLGDSLTSDVATIVLTPAGGETAQFVARNVFTLVPGAFIDPQGVLATLVIDTAGAPEGEYDIRLFSTAEPGSKTAFFNGFGEEIEAELGGGVLNVVIPEPAGLSVLGLLAVARRRGAGRSV